MPEKDRRPLTVALAEAEDVAIRPERLTEVSQIAAANVALLRAEAASEDFGRQPSDFVRALRAARDE